VVDPMQQASGHFANTKHVHRGPAAISRNSVRELKMESQTTISISGLWFAAWLFTVGYAKLGFWPGLLALVIWPYYLGGALAH